jgi:hypothetical protein
MKDHFCSNCGRQPARETCCWSQGPDGSHAAPCRLIPPPRWEEWDEDERFLIELMMEAFGGAAEEWELLRRLPWPRWRLEEQVIDFEDRTDGAAASYPCFREPDEKDRGHRYFLSDLARASFTVHQREEEAAAAFARGFPFGRYRGPDDRLMLREDPDGSR